MSACSSCQYTLLESVTGFVTCISLDKCWLACVIRTIQDDSCVRLTFLHPHGPSNSFKYPVSEDVQTIPLGNIISLVDPRTRTGRAYTLSKNEVTSATESFQKMSIH